MTENWYIILELEFDPPVQDEGVIAAKIEEKAKFWSQKFNDFKMGPQYRAWHQGISQIKKDMLGPGNIRAELAADACTRVYGPVDKLLKTISRKGFITEDEQKKTAEKQKVSLELVKRRAVKLGIRVEQGGNEKLEKLYEKYYKTKPQGAANFDGMAQLLASFQTDNLYGFLFDGTSVDQNTARSMPCKALTDRSQEKKRTEFSGHTSVAGSGAKLCGQCELIFKNETEKARYDEYLEYQRRKKVFDEIKQIADISGQISAQAGSDLIVRMTEVVRNRDLAAELVAAYCLMEKIVYVKAEGGTPQHIKVCRCGCTNDVSDGRKVCKACGRPLTIQCPKCGTENDASVRVCKCGFNFDGIDKARALCALAESSMTALDFAAARIQLKDAAGYWPGSPEIAALEKKLTEYEGRVGAEVAKMRKAMEQKRYCEAKTQYESICRLFPGYKDPAVEAQTLQAVKDAQSLFQRARESRQETQVLELCAQAYELCADLPGVKELMAQYPPEPLTGLEVLVNPNTRVNQLQWRGDASDKTLRYVVVRSDSGWVRSVSDGEVLYRGSAEIFLDKEIQPGAVYYYNVFVERAGIYSKGARWDEKPVANLFEIRGLTATPGNGTVNLSWEPLPRGATAEVYLVEEGGMEQLLSTSAADGYLARNLENDRPYRFRVNLVYNILGKRRPTRGMQIAAVPTPPAEPVDTVRVKPGAGTLFDIIWYQEGNQEVRLYGSREKPKGQLGDVLSLDTLEQQMRLLQTRPLLPASRDALSPGERGLAIEYGGEDVLYVAPVVIKGNSATFGAVARVMKGAAVEIRDVLAVNGNLTILIEPARGATGYVVLYRHDRFPTDLSDGGAVRKYIPLKQYELSGSLILEQLVKKTYYLSVFAEFRSDGEKDYSPGTQRLYDNSPKANITYSLSYRKPLFGAKILTVRFSCPEQREFYLPEVQLLSKQGSVPMFKAAATLVHTIAAQTVKGNLAVDIPLNAPKNTYVKVFFRDDADAGSSQLRLDVNSSYQIT